MLSLLWLLLPVAAVSGWYAAKRSQAKFKVQSSVVSPKYYQGLNYLIDEKPDKAIQVFSQLIEANDQQSLDLHLALGNLFRRRGEVDRAIHIHANLLGNVELDSSVKYLATIELAHDYLRAGLLDRAEGLLLELNKNNSRDVEVLLLLQKIYQQEKDWRKAIDIVVRNKELAKKQNNVIAHYYCELAEEASKARNVKDALALLDQALNFDNHCVRANILRGKIYAQSDEYAKCFGTYQCIATQNPLFLGEVIDEFLECAYHLGKIDEVMKLLRDNIKGQIDLRCLEVLTDLLREQKNDDQAVIFLINELNDSPSLGLLLKLFEINTKQMQGELKDTCRVATETLAEIIKLNPNYLCESCGFAGRTLHWLCPGCKTWGSTMPVANSTSYSSV